MISNNRPGSMPRLGGSAPLTIPSVGISQADGAAMEANLGAPVNVSLLANPDGILDQVISSCWAGWCFAYGTSMASPAAAGVAALIKQANPGMPLGVLKTKTRSNLSSGEQALLDDLLYKLRMRYVQAIRDTLPAICRFGFSLNVAASRQAGGVFIGDCRAKCLSRQKKRGREGPVSCACQDSEISRYRALL